MTVDGRDLARLAESLARDAGVVLLEHAARDPVAIETKSSATDMVSAADHAAEQLIRLRLAAERPDDAILGEEGGGAIAGDRLTWIVDPLDGTTNYLYRFPAWAVSIAVRDADGLLAGCVHDPLRGETFTAARDAGAALDGQPIRATGQDRLELALVGTGFSYDAAQRGAQAEVLRAVLPRVRDVRRAGSAALDLCSVASGRLDGYYESGLGEWDWSAGLLIATEAGAAAGWRETAAGRQLIVATTGIHAALADLVAAAAAEDLR